MPTVPSFPDLHAFLEPRAVAVIGASREPGRPGRALFDKVRDRMRRTGGEIFPVHPAATDIDGVPCVPRLADVPRPVDVAVILTSDVEPALESVAEARVPFAIVFGAGFSETGPEGAARERRLVDIARRGGVRLFGPNTNVNLFETFADLPGPKVALVTQSGHQGRPIVQGEELGVGFRRWVPTGNEADLECADFIAHFAGDDEVGAIAAYVEGFRDGEKLRRAADLAISRRKPVVLVKIGRSRAGAEMALSHTGHLAGSDAAHDALFRQYGMVRVDDLDELLETAALFTRVPKPRGRGVCVYAISGGSSALMADWLGTVGLGLPPLAPETQRRLRDLIPPYLTVRNPVDNGAAVLMQGLGPQILDALFDDPATDVLVVPVTGVLPPLSDIFAQEIFAAHHSRRKPVVVVWGSPKTDVAAYRTLVEGRVPLFRSFRGCAKALRAFLDWHDLADRWESPLAATMPAVVADPGPLLEGKGPLAEHESKQVLAACGVPVTRERVCRTAGEAARAAREIGWPVALKVASAGVAHKSEAGLVRLGLGDEEAVRAAFAEIDAAARRAFPEARLDGVLVQEMVAPGCETLVGLKHDPQLGPVLAFGLGGIFAEALGDVALRTLPATPRDVSAMIREIRGFRVLEGTRGKPPGDLEALADALLRVAALGTRHRDRIAELDINPLVVFERGKGVRAVDALIVRGPGGPGHGSQA